MSAIQEMRDYLAVEVMGWHIETRPYIETQCVFVETAGPCWVDEAGKVAFCDAHTFTPDTDANQALMLLEKAHQAGFACVIERSRSYQDNQWLIWLVYDDDFYGLPPEAGWRAKEKTLPLAICRAVKAWREAQE